MTRKRMQMNHDKFQSQVKKIYDAVGELEAMFPGRPFTPDGHMVGSLGECLVADAYDLELMPPSNEGFDAVAKDGRKVEIKATQSNSVAFRSCTGLLLSPTIGWSCWHECIDRPI